jgi:hypothetical protein
MNNRSFSVKLSSAIALQFVVQIAGVQALACIYSMKPRMDTDKPNAACTATTDFGLRREAKRHAAFGCNRRTESGVAATLCHRSPNLCRPCAKLQDWITDIYSTPNAQLSTFIPYHRRLKKFPFFCRKTTPDFTIE